MNKLTYQTIKGALDLSSLRQDTISSNLSNINTPNYKANRVVFESNLNNAKNKLNLHKTRLNHIVPSDSIGTVEKQNNRSIKDNGNDVDVDFEMAELASNSIYYNSVVSQLNAKYKMMRNAIQ